jgi:hypothetical protein
VSGRGAKGQLQRRGRCRREAEECIVTSRRQEGGGRDESSLRLRS